MRSVAAKELRGPVAMAQGPGNLIYITEIAGGAVLQIDVATGARRVVADEAARIVGMAVMKALERAAGPWPQREAPRRPYA